MLAVPAFTGCPAGQPQSKTTEGWLPAASYEALP
jgi:hypothetical protein